MVSVIIPTFNRADKISQSIESVLNQTYHDLELIIVDDCSTDSTESIIKKMQEKDSRIRYYKLSKNSGACIARNKGIELAKGDYIAFQDSDDEWMPAKLDLQLQVLENKNDNIDITTCQMQLVRADGTCEGVLPKNIQDGFIQNDIFNLGTQTLVAKREVFNELLFDPSFPRFQDLEWLSRAKRKYSIFCINEVLVKHEIGTDSISNNADKLVRACKLLLQKDPSFTENYPETSKQIAEILISNANRVRKEKKKYKEMLQLSRKYYRSIFLDIKSLLVILKLYSVVKKIKRRGQLAAEYSA